MKHASCNFSILALFKNFFLQIGPQRNFFHIWTIVQAPSILAP
jgi:hypothetical protein